MYISPQVHISGAIDMFSMKAHYTISRSPSHYASHAHTICGALTSMPTTLTCLSLSLKAHYPISLSTSHNARHTHPFAAQVLSSLQKAILSLYSSGRTTGVVVDCGDGVTSAVPSTSLTIYHVIFL